jgi:hypothetical protein
MSVALSSIIQTHPWMLVQDDVVLCLYNRFFPHFSADYAAIVHKSISVRLSLSSILLHAKTDKRLFVSV